MCYPHMQSVVTVVIQRPGTLSYTDVDTTVVRAGAESTLVTTWSPEPPEPEPCMTVLQHVRWTGVFSSSDVTIIQGDNKILLV